MPNRGSRRYFDLPALGLLVLNAGAIAALVAFWDAVPPHYRAAFWVALVAFGFGVILAVLSLYYQFLSDRYAASYWDEGRARWGRPDPMRDGRRSGLARSLSVAAGILIVLVLLLLLVFMLRNRLVGWGGIPAYGGLLVLVAAVLVALPALFGSKYGAQTGSFSLAAARLGLTAFLIGVLLPFGAWAADKVTPDPAVPDPVRPGPVDPDPVAPDPVTPDPVTPDPVTPDPVTPDPVTPDPVTPDPVTPDPVTPDPDDSVPPDDPYPDPNPHCPDAPDPPPAAPDCECEASG